MPASDRTNVDQNAQANPTRRHALVMLGISAVAVYVAPALLTLKPARASGGSGGGSAGGSGGGSAGDAADAASAGGSPADSQHPSSDQAAAASADSSPDEVVGQTAPHDATR